MKISDAIKRIMLIVVGAIIGVAGIAGFQRYRQLHRRKQLVVQAATFISSFQVFANVLYFTYPNWTFTWMEWNGVAFGMITSIAACYYGLYAIWHSYAIVETAKEEIFSRLGIPFIRNIGKLGQRIDERFSKLTPEQKTRVLNVIDNFADKSFDKISDMAKPKPKPKRKKVRRLKE